MDLGRTLVRRSFRAAASEMADIRDRIEALVEDARVAQQSGTADARLPELQVRLDELLQEQAEARARIDALTSLFPHVVNPTPPDGEADGT